MGGRAGDEHDGDANPLDDQPGTTLDAALDVEGRRHQVFADHVLPEVDVLLRVALTLTRHWADAEDLVQDTLIRAFKACDRFNGAHPRAWLMTILRNTHLNRVRARRPGLLLDPETHEGELVTWPGAPLPPTPEDVVVAPVFDEVVARALTALPAVFGSAVRLVDLDGLSYAEAAEVLGVPAGTVMSRLHRGRARIREHLVAGGMVAGLSRRAACTARAGVAFRPDPETDDTSGPSRTTKGWRRGGRT